MSNYISREAVVRYLKGYSDKECNSNSPYGMITSSVLNKVERALSEMPAADVQPINPWISVDEALPIYEGLVLAVDNNNTIRLGIYTDLGWTSQFGNSMVAHITHWQPLPEPPKDGDTNG